MWIDFECSGGFANLRLKFKVHTEELPQELAAEIKELVAVSGYFNIQPSDVTPAVKGPPDVFHYKVTVADGNQKHALSCNDVSAPPALHPLLEKFRTFAMDRRRQGK